MIKIEKGMVTIFLTLEDRQKLRSEIEDCFCAYDEETKGNMYSCEYMDVLMPKLRELFGKL